MRLFLRAVSSRLIYSLGLGLKACTTRFLWQTSMATGIKGLCYSSLFCKADQCGRFTIWTSGKLYLLKYKWNYHYRCKLLRLSHYMAFVGLTSRQQCLWFLNQGPMFTGGLWCGLWSGWWQCMLLIPQEAEAGRTLSLRPAWSTVRVPG